MFGLDGLRLIFMGLVLIGLICFCVISFDLVQFDSDSLALARLGLVLFYFVWLGYVRFS